MPELRTFGVFLPAALLLLVVPGPAVVYIVTRSIHQGRTAGLVSTCGIAVGSLVHVVAAAFGLSAILVSSAAAYTTVKYLGAAYLIWLGVRTWLGRGAALTDAPGTAPRPLGRLFGQGVVVNVLNPKTGLFFFAFLPQFVEPGRGAVPVQIAVLGTSFVLLGLMSDSTYAVLAATARRFLAASRRFTQVQRYVSGTVFVGLGATAALSGSRPD